MLTCGKPVGSSPIARRMLRLGLAVLAALHLAAAGAAETPTAVTPAELQFLAAKSLAARNDRQALDLAARP